MSPWSKQWVWQSINLGRTLHLKRPIMVTSFGADGVGGNANTTGGDGYYELDVTVGTTTFEHHFYRLLGDVTGDGVVNNSDLTDIASELALSSPTGYTPLSADVNGDGTVTSMDVTLATRAKGHKLGSGLPLG